MTFFTKIEEDDFDGVQQMIDNDPKIIDQKINGVTPLYHAVKHSDLKMIELLLINKADPNQKSPSKCFRTPISRAVGDIDSIEIIGLLIKYKASLEEVNYYGMTPIFYAVSKNNVEYLEYLIKAGANVNHTDCFGALPLHYAARSGFVKIAEVLIKAGSNLNIGDKHNNATPIYDAIDGNHLEVVRVLLDNGVNIEPVDYSKVTDQLWKFTHVPPVLHYAVKKSRFEIVKLLVERGADINGRSSYNSTPLHYAADQDDSRITSYLLSFPHIQVNAKNNNGSIPVTDAIIHRNKDNIRLLIQHGADLTSVNIHGIGPMSFPDSKRKKEIEEYCKLPKLR